MIWVAIVALACLIEAVRNRRLRKIEQIEKQAQARQQMAAGPDWEQDEPFPECFEEE